MTAGSPELEHASEQPQKQQNPCSTGVQGLKRLLSFSTSLFPNLLGSGCIPDSSIFCWRTQQESRPAGAVSGYEFFLLTGLATGSPLQTVCGRWCQISAMIPLFL